MSDELQEEGASNPPKKVRLSSGDGGSSGRKEEWSDMGVLCLLEIYGNKYSSVRRGSLSSRDWEDLAAHVNRNCKDVQAAKTSDQCKYKIENMKRRYKLEKTKKASDSGLQTLWPFFCKMDQILSGTGSNQGKQHQVIGIPGGIDAGSLQNINAAESQAESDSPSMMMMQLLNSPIRSAVAPPAAPPATSDDHHKITKKIKKQNAGGSISDSGLEMAKSIRVFAEAILKIEQAKIDLIRDLEKERAVRDLKRTQMLLAEQREIVQLLINSNKNNMK